MSIDQAVKIFSPDITSALSYLVDIADGIICKESFGNARATIRFMESCYKWWLIHDVSNHTKHLHHRLPAARHFDSPKVKRIDWLESEFLKYIEVQKTPGKNGSKLLTKQTLDVLKLTLKSTALCIRHILERKILLNLFSQENFLVIKWSRCSVP